MKYLEIPTEEQETTINILYEEQIVKVYSNRKEVVQGLTKSIGKPTKKYRKGKTYWCGADWDIDFCDLEKIKNILNSEIFVDNKFKPKKKKELKVSTDDIGQLSIKLK